MTFDDILSQVEALLAREKRVSNRGLKRRFQIDDGYLGDIREELIAKRLAVDEEGRFLVWAGSSSEAERRQLTVMFCDLVGSSALSEQLDPEDLREVVRSYQATCTEAVRRYEGEVVQHLGDGLLVYFGYPLAHEDDAQRAVRASLDIIATVGPRCFAPLPGGQVPLQVRIGIHTGVVVVGEIGSSERREHLALGEAPNVAARLQGLAEPDTIVISAATRNLVAGLFELQDLGVQTLKGLTLPIAVYRVMRESQLRGHFGSSFRKGLTPLVGRELELAELRRHWGSARNGHGQVVLLSGEAGLGKSRLIQQVREQVDSEGHARIEFGCSPYHRNSAFFPVIELLQGKAGFQATDPPATRLLKLRKLLDGYRSADDETLSLLTSLLSLPQTEGVSPLTLRPKQQKLKTVEAIVAVFLEDAEHQSLLVVVEDLHWADPSTLELIHFLVERGSGSRLLTLLSFRPEFEPPTSLLASAHRIALGRLGTPEIQAIVGNLTAGRLLPAELVLQIASRTDGVPLFAEELTKMLLESDLCKEEDGRYVLTRAMPSFAIPATLQDSLTARLDHLAPVREIAQWAAVLGREFTYELLQAVAPFSDGRLSDGLRRLVEAELVCQVGAPPQADYSFRHALMRDTAYQSVLKNRRQMMHARTAQVLEERFPEVAETQPEVLALHCFEARLEPKAIEYWHRAGLRAAQRSAYVEAVNHLERGIAVLNASASWPERLSQELALQSTLGPVLIATKGWGAPQTHQAYLRMRDLSAQLGKTEELFRALRGIVSAQILEGKLNEAQELGEQLLGLAAANPLLLLEAHNTLGFATTYLGESGRARSHLEQAVALHTLRPTTPADLRPSLTAQDPSVAGRAHLAFPLWMLGFPEQALQRSNEALRLASELSHPFSIVYASCLKSMLHSFRGEAAPAQEHAENVLRLSREHGFSAWWLGNGLCISGWSMIEQGEPAAGIDRLAQGIAAIRRAGTELVLPYYLGLLATACAAGGQVAQGFEAVDEAMRLVDRTAQRLWEPELHRKKGELVLMAGGLTADAESEACFLDSMALAAKASAKSWELRSATDLARLWLRRGDGRRASSVLSEIYGSFTEGHDSRDLQQARALLAEMG